MKTLQSIRKYGQYYRPIAPRTLFWPNSGSNMSRAMCASAAANELNGWRLLSALIDRFPRLTNTEKISHGNDERTYQTHTDERTYRTRTDSRGPAVACILARHDRQSADQRHGAGNGEAVPESYQRSRGRSASQGRGLRQRGRRLLPESLRFHGQA